MEIITKKDQREKGSVATKPATNGEESTRMMMCSCNQKDNINLKEKREVLPCSPQENQHS